MIKKLVKYFITGLIETFIAMCILIVILSLLVIPGALYSYTGVVWYLLPYLLFTIILLIEAGKNSIL